MGHFKVFIKDFILIALIIQFGNLLLSKTRFHDNYKKISGILMAVCLITNIFSLELSLDKIYLSDVNTDFTHEDTVKTKFQNNLKVIIEEDIHNKYYVNLFVNIETNYDFLAITVSGEIPKGKERDIKHYIKNKYCTPNDEVIIQSEGT